MGYNKMFFLILLFIFLSCSEDAVLLENGTPILTIPDLSISSVDIVKWRVGVGMRKTLSKGINFKLKMPHLGEDDLIKLNRKYKIDSWLIQIDKKSSLGSKKIGQLVVPFFSRSGIMSSSGAINQIDEMFINIYYNAVLGPRNMENMYCPPQGHNKMINDFNVLEMDTAKVLRITKKESRSVLGKLNTVSYSIGTVSGGKGLTGKFYISLALFNSVRKTRMTNFIQASGVIEVLSEMEKIIPGCTREMSNKRKNRRDVLKSLKW